MKKTKIKIGKDLANLLKTRFKTKIKTSKKVYSKKDRKNNKNYKRDIQVSFFLLQLFISLVNKKPLKLNK